MRLTVGRMSVGYIARDVLVVLSMCSNSLHSYQNVSFLNAIKLYGNYL